MEPLLIYSSRWRFVLLTLLMLPFALFGLFLLVSDELEAKLMGLFFTALFGGLATFGLVQLLRRKPVIVLNDAGIEDTRLKIGVIPYSEVMRAYELPYLWYKNVQVQVRNPAQFQQRQPALMRAMSQLNASMGWTPFVLMMTTTDSSARVVVDYINQQLLRQWPAPAPVVAGPATSMPAPEEGEY